MTKMVYIAADHADARRVFGINAPSRNAAFITPRSDGSRGWTAEAVAITPAALAHPKLAEMLAAAQICTTSARSAGRSSCEDQ